jgi:hypothetical protein
MSLRVAAGTWAVISFLLYAAFAMELLDDARAERLFLALALATGSAWLAHRLWRQPSRTIAIVAGTCGAFLVLLAVYGVIRSGFDALAASLLLIMGAALGGWLPFQRRNSFDA